MSFFKQKILWLGLIGIALIAIIFTFAFLGSTVNPAPKDLPVALVVKDEGVTLPTKEKLNIGEELKKQLTENKDLPFKWTILDSKDKAVKGMDDRNYYAALVIPSDFSAKSSSLMSPKPVQAEAQLILNQGKNQNAVNAIGQIFPKIFEAINGKVQQQMLMPFEKMQKPLSVQQAKIAGHPIALKTDTIHQTGDNSGGGNAPTTLTQIIWITTLISSAIIFTAVRKAHSNTIKPIGFLYQLLAGAVFTAVNALIVLYLAAGVLDLHVPDYWAVYGFMLFASFMFFLMQGALLNWLGFGGMPILVLLFFFSNPVLALAPEMLPDVTKTWLYSWTPFRFSVEGLRSIFFYDGRGLGDNQYVLGIVGLVCFAVMALALVKPLLQRGSRKEASVERN
ncbi:YhgE/Pip family protein [Metabacillus sp. GX 13764]|uniref:YhgE/Pip domain-containing protein n=1 Tax=Metabacillus kandeliae TaxID=2900151 RepID=UPI001E29A793|nr:YhgE/Pip family protein [Metabacillus kandeliae]MCD7034377.1 YhgE/Pip family protein [Metabacillus kandeliae]